MASPLFFRIGVFAAALLICPSFALGGLERIRRSSVVVIYATEEGGRALDCVDGNCGSGPLAKAIEAALKVPGLTIAGFFDAVNADVALTTRLSQRPRLEASGPISVPLVRKPGSAAALVIGNGAYANMTPLRGAPRDAEIVASALSGAGFQTRAIIDAKLPALNAAVDGFFARLNADDTAIVYYAGHGLQIDGENYLPTIEAETSDGKAPTPQWFAVSSLVSALSESSATHKILILDTDFLNMDVGAAYRR